MLQMYSDSAVGVSAPVGSNIVFNNKTIQTGCTATANTPANTVALNRAGIYMVEFNGIISGVAAPAAPAAIPTAANFVGVQMFRNGDEVPEALAGAVSASDTALENVSFTTLVRVRPNCCAVNNDTRLTFQIVGNDALVHFANVVVTKLA